MLKTTAKDSNYATDELWSGTDGHAKSAANVRIAGDFVAIHRQSAENLIDVVRISLVGFERVGEVPAKFCEMGRRDPATGVNGRQFRPAVFDWTVQRRRQELELHLPQPIHRDVFKKSLEFVVSKHSRIQFFDQSGELLGAPKPLKQRGWGR